ncbi:hypothetical protein BCV70DRAFT_5636 [Testicularia cyperi]|uniref:C2H2-type domain-containing protein n=1 Tax=Testicularia cyperi TaxID=1882483 RepID=A0A317XXD5_9BASI|nr:hypothetical protein BCV70DRAFT_5636 [Testicularia cyperi]
MTMSLSDSPPTSALARPLRNSSSSDPIPSALSASKNKQNSKPHRPAGWSTVSTDPSIVPSRQCHTSSPRHLVDILAVSEYPGRSGRLCVMSGDRPLDVLADFELLSSHDVKSTDTLISHEHGNYKSSVSTVATPASPFSNRSRISSPKSAKKEAHTASPTCLDVLCCDNDHTRPSTPCPAVAECTDCHSTRMSSPCSDAHHISSACTEPVCAAASTSASAACAAAVSCCDATDCTDAPASPCTAPVCGVVSPCSATSATCCTDDRCEADAVADHLNGAISICDGIIDNSVSCDSAKSHDRTECPDCRGSVSAGQASQHGRLYSSFQELLDCCCCSMPPMADQCCVGDESLHGHIHHRHHDSHHHDTQPVPPQASTQSISASTEIPPPPAMDTPSSSVVSVASRPTPVDLEVNRSRSSTASTALTPQNMQNLSHSRSPSLANHLAGDVRLSTLSQSKTTQHLQTSDPQQIQHESPSSSSWYDTLGGFECWNDCRFQQPHLHSVQGLCLPPALTLCDSSICSSATPHVHWSHTHSGTKPSHTAVPSQDERRQVCQWAGCNERFWTVQELVAHVNHSHLAGKTSTDNASVEGVAFDNHHKGQSLEFGSSGSPQTHISQQSVQSLPCQWNDCHQVPLSTPIAELADGIHSNGWLTDSQLNDKFSLAMLQHLLHDHLNQGNVGSLPLVKETTGPDLVALFGPTGSETPKGASPHLQRPQKMGNDDTAPLFKRRRCDSCSGGEEDDALRCRWEGCSESFSNHSALTEHITKAHVGSGKNEYECRWAGCVRNAEGKKFSQKQKVLRHIQTHTGDRPHKCMLCGKRFSEPNTLAQHMRTHTQEKPYVCDYPGCGKAFSVAGSLTIHKRIHTGAKPFVCSFPGCGKAFAESSNLTKHMRTHTGDKPFECKECGKRFSRPDQASRHRKTHERKRQRNLVAAEVGSE